MLLLPSGASTPRLVDELPKIDFFEPYDYTKLPWNVSGKRQRRQVS
jgi:hypothetical protein